MNVARSGNSVRMFVYVAGGNNYRQHSFPISSMKWCRDARRDDAVANTQQQQTTMKLFAY